MLENAPHERLKRLAFGWALQHRLILCAAEVRVPRSRFRADVAAASPRIAATNAFTALFECKASRSDFLRDAAQEGAFRLKARELGERLIALQERIGEHRPDLRRGEELFPEFECCDLRGLRHDTYRRLARRLAVAQSKLQSGTKFSRMARWRSASLLYAVTEPGVLEPWELPPGWGWLERGEDSLRLRVKPCLHPTTPAERIALLERIAAAASATAARHAGVALPVYGCAARGGGPASSQDPLTS